LNAKIWTGGKNGTEVVEADILLDKGIIKGIGHVGRLLSRFDMLEEDAVVHDVNGAWVTPGLVPFTPDSLGNAESRLSASWICILILEMRPPLSCLVRVMIILSRVLSCLG
jgi:hypothetical protein